MITRRDLLRGVAGTVGLLGWPPGPASGEPPPETTRLRLYHSPSICVAPQYIVGDLLKSEGFSDVKYVKITTAGISKALASGEVDVSLHFVAPLVIQLDAGDPITVLGGVHPGCFELFGTDRVRVIRDLNGKTVAITELGQPAHVFLSSMLAHVGLDPHKASSSSSIPLPSASGCSRRGRSTPTSLFCRSLRSSAPGRSDTWLSTARSTGHGHSTFAASPRGIGSSSVNIQSRPSARCGRSSKRLTYAPSSLSGPLVPSSMAASHRATTMRSRP